MTWTDGSPLMLKNPQHHFYFDAGIKGVFTDAPLVFTHPAQTLPVATVFPSIELTHEQHVTAHIFGDNWLASNGYPRALQMTKDDWLRLYGDGKWNELAEEMVRGANTKGANITPNKVAKLKNACAGRLTQFNRRKSCAGL